MAHERRDERADRRARLDLPASPRRVPRVPRPSPDSDLFGRFSEGIARFFGTARFLFIQTVIVAAWIGTNIWLSHTYGKADNHFDPYPFILLNLVFSTQAAYAAPLILLAQNRQADRDRVQYDEDRRRDERSVADTEFLVREVASLRLALGEIATRDYLRSELRDLLDELDRRDGNGGRAVEPAGRAAGPESASSRDVTPPTTPG